MHIVRADRVNMSPRDELLRMTRDDPYLRAFSAAYPNWIDDPMLLRQLCLVLARARVEMLKAAVEREALRVSPPLVLMLPPKRCPACRCTSFTFTADRTWNCDNCKRRYSESDDAEDV